MNAVHWIDTQAEVNEVAEAVATAESAKRRAAQQQAIAARERKRADDAKKAQESLAEMTKKKAALESYIKDLEARVTQATADRRRAVRDLKRFVLEAEK